MSEYDIGVSPTVESRIREGLVWFLARERRLHQLAACGLVIALVVQSLGFWEVLEGLWSAVEVVLRLFCGFFGSLLSLCVFPRLVSGWALATWIMTVVLLSISIRFLGVSKTKRR